MISHIVRNLSLSNLRINVYMISVQFVIALWIVAPTFDENPVGETLRPMQFGDLTTLITIAIAVFIFMRLRSVLGKRTGHQGPTVRPYRDESGADQHSNDNVVTLSTRKNEAAGEEPQSEAIRQIDAIADKRSKLNKSLKMIADIDPSFLPDQFISGSKMAYEMIINAFADGDKKTLKNLLTRDVYEGFVAVIDQRQKDGLVVKSSFVGVDEASLIDAELVKNDASLTVRFVSQIISATFNDKNELIDGDEEQIVEVIDLWTFERNMRSRDPNWKLAATTSEH